MTNTVVAVDARAALDQVRAGLDHLLNADLGVPEDDTLLEVVREFEVERRRIAAVDARLVGEVDARGIAHDKGALPQVAAALRAGVISGSHAATIVKTIDALPMDVQATKDREIEGQLVDEARRFAPYQLRTIAHRLLYLYDQDGTLADDADRARRRSLDYRRRADGTMTGRFDLDPLTAEAFETVMDSLLHTVSADERGDRSPTQLRHDALRDLLLMCLRTGHLPATGGVTTTIVVTLSLVQYAAMTAAVTASAGGAAGTAAATSVGRKPPRQPGPPGERLAVTNHGAPLTVDEVAPLLGDAQVLPVVLSTVGSIRRVEAYGDKHRIFTENQRLALAARDHGCTFPGCTSTPAWCEAHHVVDAADHGPTAITNGTLLCPYHHRNFQDLGYRCVMLDGAPHWIAPPWIDPSQTPERNTAHDPERG